MAESTRLDRLESLRSDLEAVMSAAEPGQFAALSREYRAVMAEIHELKPPEKVGDSVDEIAERRAARRSRTASRAGRSEGAG